MKKILICLFICLLLIGCSNNLEESELDKIVSKNNYIVVDVRTKEEYDVSHVKGSINIPYDEINEETDLDKTKTILVYCKSGTRSNIAYNTLISLGYDAYDMGAFDSINLEISNE